MTDPASRKQQEERLKEYYEQELQYLRKSGEEFGRRHEEIARQLRLEGRVAGDPHVERLLEGFAFLTARVHRRIDDDLGEICQSFLNLVAPHYLRPIPSMSVVELVPDAGAPTSGFRVDAGSSLVAPPEKATGVRCRFRTCYDVTVWPLRVVDASWQGARGLDLGIAAGEAAAALRVVLETTHGDTFGTLELDRLRFHLDGPFRLVSTIYELADNSCLSVVVRDREDRTKVVNLGSGAIGPVGFEEDEGMVPHPGGAFLGYRLIQEYFSFPQKFLFFDLLGLDRIRAIDFGSSLEIVFLFRTFEGSDRQAELESGVTKSSIRLGCTPVVNLFDGDAEPLRIDQRSTEYVVQASGGARRYPYEVFSVKELWAVASSPARRIPFAPFFSFKHRRAADEQAGFWYSRRAPSSWIEPPATDVILSFVDVSGQVLSPPFPSAMARLELFNGALPERLSIGRNPWSLDLEGGGAPVDRIRPLTPFTVPVQPPLDSSLHWRLISQLSLNHLSLLDEEGEALRALLGLHSFGDPATGEKHIRGIRSVRGAHAFARVSGPMGFSFARGRKVDLEFDEALYSDGGIYLLAAILERFFGLYASINSFTTTVARVRRKEKTYPLRAWPPRAGSRPLV